MHDSNSVCFVYEKKELPATFAFIQCCCYSASFFEGMLIHLNPFQMSIFHHYQEVDFYHQTQWDG